MKVFLSYSTNSHFNKDRELFAKFLAENNHTLVSADLTDTVISLFNNEAIKMFPHVDTNSSDFNQRALFSIFETSDLMVFFPGGLNTTWMLVNVLHRAYYAKVNKPIILVNLGGAFDNIINTIKVSLHESPMLSPNISWYYVANDLLSAQELINQVSILDFKPLSSVVHIGDYVNYPVKYENVTLPNGQKSKLSGWRVLNVVKNHVQLISAGTPIMATFSEEEYNNIIIDEINDFDVFKNHSTNFSDDLHIQLLSRPTLYPKILAYDDIRPNSEESLFHNGTDVYCYSLETGKILLLKNDKTINNKPFGTYGVRPVVTLTNTVLAAGKDKDGVWII